MTLLDSLTARQRDKRSRAGRPAKLLPGFLGYSIDYILYYDSVRPWQAGDRAPARAGMAAPGADPTAQARAEPRISGGAIAGELRKRIGAIMATPRASCQRNKLRKQLRFSRFRK
jgi:hypothetical protein